MSRIFYFTFFILCKFVVEVSADFFSENFGIEEIIRFFDFQRRDLEISGHIRGLGD